MMRNTSPRMDLDDTLTVISEGRGFATSTISSSGSAARAVARNAMSPETANRCLSSRRSSSRSIDSGMWMTNVMSHPGCRVTRGSWILTLALTLAISAGPLSNRLHRELAARDFGERVGDTLRGDGDLEEFASELFVGDVVVVLHRLIPSHVACQNGR